MDEIEHYNVHGFKTEKSDSLLGHLSYFSISHSLSLSRHLISFGYGIPHQTYIKQSDQLYSLRNVLRYLRSLYKRDGHRIFLIGVDTNIALAVIECLTTSIVPQFLDANCSEFGGTPVNRRLSEYDMDEFHSLRIHIRTCLRECVYNTLLAVVQRPLMVVLARQIAQYTIGESKYHGVLHSIRLIGTEEGIPGFFSGLIPSILHGLCVSAAFWGFRYLISRCVVYIQRYAVRKHCSRSYEFSIYLRAAFPFLLPLIRYRCGSMFYRLDSKAKIMALAGSGLDVPISRYHHAIVFPRRSAFRRNLY
ncbi:unnamed protein product [Bursaphelenchus xylophilus]|uniref:(pine wood nematode) hypothetical protein n=1 Tax=Bursaphelenchus xylophilus TaxID=6326 RepID=A0A1I7S9C2_BURXY|nr:unnamed protein product [Bursaphelenchus xylophilus]CAG9100513.1 unnamed protein product [Bursaphelenchus xylophilus]